MDAIRLLAVAWTLLSVAAAAWMITSPVYRAMTGTDLRAEGVPAIIGTLIFTMIGGWLLIGVASIGLAFARFYIGPNWLERLERHRAVEERAKRMKERRERRGGE